MGVLEIHTRQIFTGRTIQGVTITLLAIIIITIQTQQIVRDDSPHCIWYGACYTDEDGITFNCPYNGAGHLVEDEWSRRVLFDRCPNVYKNGE